MGSAMLPVSAAEMAQIRADAAAAALDLPCTIQRKTVTKDAWGSESETWTTISPNGLLAGLRSPTSTHLQNYDYLIAGMATWEVQLPYGTDVAELDHIIIDNHTLIMQKDLSPQSYNALTTVLASEVG